MYSPWPQGAIGDAVETAARALGAQQQVDVFRGQEADWLEAYHVLQGAEIWASARRVDHPAAAGIRSEHRAALCRPRRQLRRRRWRKRKPSATRRAHISRPCWRPDRWLALPTVPVLPLSLQASGEERGEFYRVTLAMTAIAGHAGLPQITLPLTSEIEGWPVALSLIGPPGADLALIAYAAQVARATDLLRRW